jgi:hypothetical protein
LFFGRKRARRDHAEKIGEWRLRDSRLVEERDGVSLDFAGRIAICPAGHPRTIPTRFDHAVTELRCRDCNRSYPLPQQ